MEIWKKERKKKERKKKRKEEKKKERKKEKKEKNKNKNKKRRKKHDRKKEKKWIKKIWTMIILKLKESYRKLEEKIEVIEVRLDRVARFETKLQKGSCKKTREKMEKREGGEVRVKQDCGKSGKERIEAQRRLRIAYMEDWGKMLWKESLFKKMWKKIEFFEGKKIYQNNEKKEKKRKIVKKYK